MKTGFLLFGRSLLLALQELNANKMRSFLSLAGITIGILCIVSVLTAVDSLKSNIEDSINSLGSNLLFVEKWPWTFGDEYPWWQYYNRPNVSEREMDLVKEQSKLAKNVAFKQESYNNTFKNGANEVGGIQFSGVSEKYGEMMGLEFEQGRYFTPYEFQSKTNAVILGSEVAKTLFPDKTDVVGEMVSYAGSKIRVVGVLKRQGKDLTGLSQDNSVLTVSGYINNFLSKNASFNVRKFILIEPKKGVKVDELKYELMGIMRAKRKIKPGADNNFAVNQISMITSMLDTLFNQLNIVGFIIGIASVIVGGFGIANIMFVSVKERTNIIGIKKALGAKRAYILMEFLLESVVLCVIGGLIGLLMVFVVFQLLELAMQNSEYTFKFTLSTFNIIVGISISIIVGLVSGILPAITASRLHPVEAMRQGA